MADCPQMSRGFFVLYTLVVLTGCTGADPDNLKPWESSRDASDNRSGSSAAKVIGGYGPKLIEGQPYVVVKGDTLYAIAFRLGIDFKDLAARNGINSPYTIKVGQTLITAEPRVPQKTRSARSTPDSVSKSKPKPVVAAPPKPKKAVKKQSKVTTVTKPSSRSNPVSDTVTSLVGSRWQWPAAGKVSRIFSTNLHKGIDIVGKRGDPVVAVAGGKVVYAGTGVTGYGSLLIIKHNDTYLSAYGHNERLLVSENTTIEAGQQIATMGSSGTDSVKLHFELRRRGQPVDPLTLLPRRR